MSNKELKKEKKNHQLIPGEAPTVGISMPDKKNKKEEIKISTPFFDEKTGLYTSADIFIPGKKTVKKKKQNKKECLKETEDLKNNDIPVVEFNPCFSSGIVFSNSFEKEKMINLFKDFGDSRNIVSSPDDMDEFEKFYEEKTKKKDTAHFLMDIDELSKSNIANLRLIKEKAIIDINIEAFFNKNFSSIVNYLNKSDFYSTKTSEFRKHFKNSFRWFNFKDILKRLSFLAYFKLKPYIIKENSTATIEVNFLGISDIIESIKSKNSKYNSDILKFLLNKMKSPTIADDKYETIYHKHQFDYYLFEVLVSSFSRVIINSTINKLALSDNIMIFKKVLNFFREEIAVKEKDFEKQKSGRKFEKMLAMSPNTNACCSDKVDETEDNPVGTNKEKIDRERSNNGMNYYRKYFLDYQNDDYLLHFLFGDFGESFESLSGITNQTVSRNIKTLLKLLYFGQINDIEYNDYSDLLLRNEKERSDIFHYIFSNSEKDEFDGNSMVENRYGIIEELFDIFFNNNFQPSNLRDLLFENFIPEEKSNPIKTIEDFLYHYRSLFSVSSNEGESLMKFIKKGLEDFNFLKTKDESCYLEGKIKLNTNFNYEYVTKDLTYTSNRSINYKDLHDLLDRFMDELRNNDHVFSSIYERYKSPLTVISENNCGEKYQDFGQIKYRKSDINNPYTDYEFYNWYKFTGFIGSKLLELLFASYIIDENSEKIGNHIVKTFGNRKTLEEIKDFLNLVSSLDLNNLDNLKNKIILNEKDKIFNFFNSVKEIDISSGLGIDYFAHWEMKEEFGIPIFLSSFVSQIKYKFESNSKNSVKYLNKSGDEMKGEELSKEFLSSYVRSFRKIVNRIKDNFLYNLSISDIVDFGHSYAVSNKHTISSEVSRLIENNREFKYLKNRKIEKIKDEIIRNFNILSDISERLDKMIIEIDNLKFAIFVNGKLEQRKILDKLNSPILKPLLETINIFFSLYGPNQLFFINTKSNKDYLFDRNRIEESVSNLAYGNQAFNKYRFRDQDKVHYTNDINSYMLNIPIRFILLNKKGNTDFRDYSYIDLIFHYQPILFEKADMIGSNPNGLFGGDLIKISLKLDGKLIEKDIKLANNLNKFVKNINDLLTIDLDSKDADFLFKQSVKEIFTKDQNKKYMFNIISIAGCPMDRMYSSGLDVSIFNNFLRKFYTIYGQTSPFTKSSVKVDLNDTLIDTILLMMGKERVLNPIEFFNENIDTSKSPKEQSKIDFLATSYSSILETERMISKY